MSDTKVYLITGANRGIGFALVNEIVSKQSNVFVYAGARNPSGATALNELTAKHPGKIQVVKYVAADVESNKAIAQTIQEKHGYVDTVIANAGIGNYFGRVDETPVENMRGAFEVNALGPFILFQAVYDLLKASKKSPRFVSVSSAAASITSFALAPIGIGAYGSSKIAGNYVARRIHAENDWIIAFPLAPGMVDTDMARESRKLEKTGAMASMLDAHQITPEAAAPQLLNLIDNATREKEGGEFMNFDGTKFAW
ncbi:hypothetical protein AX17_007506 [Amanita inopinata Kibby_2008]|nr:hypothetical protein AX17_007506 [Amanita inopinata Kibby_2008]